MSTIRHQNSHCWECSILVICSLGYLRFQIRCVFAKHDLFKPTISIQNCIYFNFRIKELGLWNKIKYLNLNIFRTRCFKPLIFQTQIIWSNRMLSLKYLRSTTFGSKAIVIRKSEFVTKSQFLCNKPM